MKYIISGSLIFGKAASKTSGTTLEYCSSTEIGKKLGIPPSP